MFLVSKDNFFFLFDCKFDDDKEDYADTYQIFVMPNLGEEEMSGSWSQLSEKAIKYAGEVSVKSVKFDESRRLFIDDDAIPKIDELKLP
jgi:hypothetical protein